PPIPPARQSTPATADSRSSKLPSASPTPTANLSHPPLPHSISQRQASPPPSPARFSSSPPATVRCCPKPSPAQADRHHLLPPPQWALRRVRLAASPLLLNSDF